MVVQRRRRLPNRPSHEKFLQRIARCYKQLDEKHAELETRLPREDSRADSPADPRKRR